MKFIKMNEPKQNESDTDTCRLVVGIHKIITINNINNYN